MAGWKSATSDELVPLAQRVRYMQVFRLITLAGVLILSAYSPETIGAELSILALFSGAYLALTLAGDGLWRLLGQRNHRNLFLFGALLIVDGVYLAWLSYATGGMTSPLRSLILLHLIAVTLLASYRTGLKLAMWHSILVLVVQQLEVSGMIAPANAASRGDEGFQRMIAFIGIFWLVALATSTFSAINERELRRRRYDLEALAQMSAKLEATESADEVAAVILDSLIDSFDFRRGVVLGLHGSRISLRASQGPDSPDREGRHFLGVDAVMRRAWESRQPQLISELEPGDNPCIRNLLPDAGNLLIVPLTAEGGSVGVVILEHSVKEGSRIERRVVSTVERFCSQGALALRNANLLEEVAAMAVTDGLTQIANRRHFEDRLEQELNRAARNGSTVTLALMDIDHFKKLNDTYGHQTGDDVLKQVAATLAATCRNFDLPARYGGEEFVVILPGCDLMNSGPSADRFRMAVKAMQSQVPVTVSVGVATFPQHATDGESLVKEADKALYESKENGRDRVTVCSKLQVDNTADEFARIISNS